MWQIWWSSYPVCKSAVGLEACLSKVLRDLRGATVTCRLDMNQPSSILPWAAEEAVGQECPAHGSAGRAHLLLRAAGL